MKTPVAPAQTSRRQILRIGLKALGLFVILNLAFAWANPLPLLGKLSLYHRLLPARERLPYGDNPQRAYNLSLFNLEAMFASHQVSAAPTNQAAPINQAGEYRVFLIGDSATWGFLLPVDETLSAQLNRMQLKAPDGRSLHFYNLGYPVMSLTKDLLLLSRAMQYQPDLVVWLFTLESFPYDKQLFPPLLQHNPAAVRAIIEEYGLNLDTSDPSFITPSFYERTIIGQRRSLADLLRLQLYGVAWAATGIDQEIPASYTPRQEDLEADVEFHNLQPPSLAASDLALDVLQAGVKLAGETPVLLVNEPMYVSQGQNSDVRYNFFYPRWAYDDYRRILADESTRRGWRYLDAWDAVNNNEFTNSAVHLSASGSAEFARALGRAVLEMLSTR